MDSLKQGEDFYIDESGLYVFTEAYHLKRGYCCRGGCRHCPFGYLGDNRNDEQKRVQRLIEEQNN